MLKNMLVATGLLALTACTDVLPGEAPTSKGPIGQFRLGHNIAIAERAVRGVNAGDFAVETLEASVQKAVAGRLRGLDGDGLYHLGMVIGGITLAEPGVPVVYAQEAAMVVDVTVYDNETGAALNETPHRIVARSRPRPATPFIGAAATAEPDAQLDALSLEAAASIETWLRANADWFAVQLDQVRVPFDANVTPPEIDTSSVADIAEAAQVTN